MFDAGPFQASTPALQCATETLAYFDVAPDGAPATDTTALTAARAFRVRTGTAWAGVIAPPPHYHLGHERSDPYRHVLVGGRVAHEVLVSARGESGRAARLVRIALRHRRGRLDVLPAAGGGDGAALGGAHAGRLRHAREGIRRHDEAPVRLDQLPTDLRDEAPVDDKGRVDRPPREFRAEIFRRFHEAFAPLRDAGKLGGILFQLPPYVVYKPSSLEYLEWSKEQLAGDEMMVEFRHASWLDEENRAETLRFLEQLGATHVIVDAPRIEGARNVVPTVPR